ncbi:Bor family protein [Ferrimonas balearica]|uniref:Bor family protein n=1 Tax=Ferrimonas balearica TaxID=44012 RepID=UPI001C994F50|nr:Bor family protein [Ferrimonas balearica]MBY5990974.1 Bor family protein [Ferrimonas balearica]
MKRLMMTLAAASLLAGCHTIHFDQEQPVASNKAQSHAQWHHNMALSLVEVSNPVDLDRNCGDNGWETVKTETTFINGLPGAVIPYLGLLWSPKTATVQCQDQQVQ